MSEDGGPTSPAPVPKMEQEATSFIVHSLNREKLGKRPYKPVEGVLMMSSMLCDDSEDEDDDEYVPFDLKKTNGKSTNHSDDDEDDDDEDDDGNDDEDDDSELSDREGSDDEEESDNDQSPAPTKSSSDAQTSSIAPKSRQELLNELTVCSVCLVKVSRNQEDVVECDSCGVMVHEYCYGVTADDCESVHSNASSASQEPWFCEPCTAGCKHPHCDLCPNLGGIFKFTDQGRWIHTVCALYNKGITFRDLEKLEFPSTREISHSELGKRTCSLCEDDRLANTGWCLKCDTGMCNTYFHITCAQRHGLLKKSEDPNDYGYYHADCPVHNKDKDVIRRKRQCYLALAAKSKDLTTQRFGSGTILESITNERNRSKLAKQTERFKRNFHALDSLQFAASRLPRTLETSPSVVRRLCTKSEATGMIKYMNQTLEDMVDIGKKWYLTPQFSVEFVGYYLDRNERIEKFTKQSHDLDKQNRELKKQEGEIRLRYEALKTAVDPLKKSNDSLRTKINEFLSKCSNSKLSSSLNGLKCLNPQVESSGTEKAASDPEIKSCGTCSKTTDQYSLAFCDTCKLHYHLACLDPPLKRMPKKNKFGGWQCSNCTEREEEEYSAMSGISAGEEEPTPNGPSDEDSMDTTDGGRNRRKLRRNPKQTRNPDEVSPFSVNASGTMREEKKQGKRQKPQVEEEKPKKSTSGTPPTGKKRGRKPYKLKAEVDSPVKKLKLENGDEEKTAVVVETPEVVINVESEIILAPNSSPLKVEVDNNQNLPKPVVYFTSPNRKAHECDKCEKPVQSKQSVRCDNCERFYHFDCLDPPVSKSPKRRGYTWTCKACETDENKRESHAHSNGQATSGVSLLARRASGESLLFRRSSKEIKDEKKDEQVKNSVIVASKVELNDVVAKKVDSAGVTESAEQN